MAGSGITRYDLDERELSLLELGIKTESRSTLLAVVLWFFLAHSGAHRFYLGKWKTGIALIAFEFVALFVLIGLTSGDESGLGGATGFLAWFWLVLPLTWVFEGVRLPFLLRHDRRRVEWEVLRRISEHRRGTA